MLIRFVVWSFFHFNFWLFDWVVSSMSWVLMQYRWLQRTYPVRVQTINSVCTEVVASTMSGLNHEFFLKHWKKEEKCWPMSVYDVTAENKISKLFMCCWKKRLELNKNAKTKKNANIRWTKLTATILLKVMLFEFCLSKYVIFLFWSARFMRLYASRSY